MPADREDRTRETACPRLFALFVIVSLLTRWLSLVVEVLDTDEAAHAVGSWVLLDGGRYVAEGYERIDEVSRSRVYKRRGCAAR